MGELHYGRVSMKRDPVNISFEKVVEKLKLGSAVFVRLEPGDGTRYELILYWHHGALVVTKIDGRDTPAAIYYTGPHLLFRLAGPNAWSQTLLNWWLNEVYKRMSNA